MNMRAKIKPIIAVTPLLDEERESIWMLPGYHDMLMRAGAIPLDVPPGITWDDASQLLRHCAGLLLTGGQDVSPRVYEKKQLPACGKPSAERDRLDSMLLDIAMRRAMPVLGICRGLQLINAHLGGTLIQDIPSQFPTKINHSMEPPYNRVQHTVNVLSDTPLAQVVGEGPWGVNSYHHQAIDSLSPELEPMSISEDGLIEAVYHPDFSFLWGVQFHPELSWNKDSRQQAICEAFVSAAMTY